MVDNQEFAEALFADMARLGARPYSQVGVPMLLIAESLRGGPTSPDPAGAVPDLASRLAAMGETLATRQPEVTTADTARLIEVLADRHLLGEDGPAFTGLSEPEDRG